MSSARKSRLVSDAVSEFLDQEIDRRVADNSLPPIYTYPANGLRPLVDKPLVRPQKKESTSN